MTSNLQIAMALRVLRERSKLSPYDLSVSAGLPPDEVSRIESGELSLDYLTAARLTQVLRIGLAEIAVAAYALDAALVKDHFKQGLGTHRATQPQVG